MCDCNRLKLSQRNIQYESSLFFYDCSCKAGYELFAIILNVKIVATMLSVFPEIILPVSPAAANILLEI